MQQTPLTLKQCQDISLDILLYFDAFCKRHGLPYVLACGTLLGAVRHGGFIPWDDDIDLYMLREDYERMLTLFAEEEHYRCISFEAGSFYLPYAKIIDTRTVQYPEKTKQIYPLGVGIDVFPIDRIGGTRAQVLKKKRRANELVRRLRYTMYPSLRSLNGDRFLPLHSAYYLFCKLFGTKHYIRKLRRCIARLYDAEGTLCSMPASNDADAMCVYDTTLFEHTAEYTFEGHNFPSFADAHTFLTVTYGDYMTPPSEEHRIPHIALSYWKDL